MRLLPYVGRQSGFKKIFFFLLHLPKTFRYNEKTVFLKAISKYLVFNSKNISSHTEICIPHYK